MAEAKMSGLSKPMNVSAIYSVKNSNQVIAPILQALEKELHISKQENLPESIKPIASSTDIIVILGDDFVE
jgi:hypothetical protein